MADLRASLIARDACNEAIAWVGDRDIATAWAECPRGDWMLWWCEKVGFPASAALLADLVEMAVAYAAPVARDLPCWPQVRKACAAVIAGLHDCGDLAAARAAAEDAEVDAAVAAAWAAVAAAEAARAAAVAAAWAAAWAAAEAARVTAEADARAAASAAARDAAGAAIADLVRRYCPTPPDQRAKEPKP